MAVVNDTTERAVTVRPSTRPGHMRWIVNVLSQAKNVAGAQPNNRRGHTGWIASRQATNTVAATVAMMAVDERAVNENSPETEQTAAPCFAFHFEPTQVRQPVEQRR